MPATPAIVSEGLEGSTNLESIAPILPHMNNDGEPLMVIMRPNEKNRVRGGDSRYQPSGKHLRQEERRQLLATYRRAGEL